VAISIAFATALAAQDVITVRDSVFIERGVAGTTNFTPEARITVTEYDDQGRPLTELRERRTQGGAWAPEVRRQFAYAEGELVDLLTQRWDGAASTWRDQRRDQYQYSNGQLQQRLRQRAPAGTLVNERRWQYLYDDAGRETGRLLQQWDGSDWESLTRRLITYTTGGEIATQVLQARVGGEWRNARNRIWNYTEVNGTPRVTETLVQVWSVSAGDWVDQQRQRFNYNAAGLWTQSLYEQWDEAEQKWQNAERTAYEYDQQVPSGVMLQVWEQDDWQNSGRAQFTFAGNSDFFSRIDTWDANAAVWVNFLRYWLQNDDNGLLRRRTGMQAWNANAMAWENRAFTQRITYSYTDLILNRVAEDVLPQACRIPNPYVPGTPFTCELPPVAAGYQLEVFDLLGRRVLTQRFADAQSLQISNRPAAGTYVVRISDGRQVLHLQRLIIH
jgi:hypothetical protein